MPTLLSSPARTSNAAWLPKHISTSYTFMNNDHTVSFNAVEYMSTLSTSLPRTAFIMGRHNTYF